MPPKKSAPPPQSDESYDESGDEQQHERKSKKREAPKTTKRGRENAKSSEEQLKEATDKLFDGSDNEDDGSDLFALQPPPPPEFLVRAGHRRDRLMILNVEVENFKSYAGKASIGPFHKSFTSIIGPNGSGKSNLIDSLLFVFGFRASKIRSPKVSALIHNSEGGNKITSCTVTIHFQRIIDRADGYEVVPDSSFEISRTAFRNGSSSYAIDGRSASKAEVEARLRLVDIDIEHNRFLILQGEVEQIATMKPVRTTKSETGMVEYLEDIIGSNRLEPFVRKFTKRVNKLNCSVSQIRISRDHARASKVSLEGSVRAAIEFLTMENEEKTIQMKLDQRRRKRFLDKVAPQQAEIEAKKEELKNIGTQLDANKNEYKEAEEKVRALNKERDKLCEKDKKLAQEIQDLSKEESQRMAEVKRRQDNIAKTEVEKEKEEKKRENLVSVPEKAEKKIKKWSEEVEQLEEINTSFNAKADANLEQFAECSAELKEEKRIHEEELAKCNVELNKIRSEATVARDEFEDMTRMANSDTKKLDELVERLASTEESFKKQVEQLEKLKPESQMWSEKYKELSVQLPAVRNKAKQANIEVSKAQENLDDLARQNSSSTGTGLIKALMKEKEAGRIPSFMGRLGDLGVIDKKYDRCISTNFGGNCNMLVVQSIEDSVRIIEYLKTNKLNKQTVLAIDKCGIRPEQYAKKNSNSNAYPGHRLFDLIECDDEVKPAFWFVLHGTLVAETVQEACKWNKSGKCRGISIATLDGSMISPNGNVTGGGKPHYGAVLTDRNKVPKKVTAEDRAAQQALTVEVEKLKKVAEQLKEEEKNLEREFHEARRKAEDTTKSVKILEASVESDASGIKALKKTIESQQAEASKVKVDMKQLEAKQKIVEDLENRRDKLSAKAGKTKKLHDEIQSKLDTIFDELVGCHRNKAKEAQDKKNKLDKDIAKEKANIANSARNIEKCDENIARFDKEIEKNKELLEKLQETAVDQEGIEVKKAELDAITKKNKEIEKEVSEITTKQSELSAAETQLEEDLKHCSDSIQDLKNKMAADMHEVKTIEKKLSGLLVNRIPRFQFLADSSRPEDVPMQVDTIAVDENQTPEEVERRKKQMATKMTDDAYAKEFEMRQKVLENTEKYENVDGDKMIPIVLLTDEQIAELTSRDNEELNFKLKQCQQQIDALKGKVDISCIDTYVGKVNQYNAKVMELAEVAESHKRHNDELQRLKKQRLDEFHSAFEFIGKHLVAVFKMLTDGGDAKLEYIDKDDPFNQGISFMVRPAKKAWKQIQFLSGGEKTLSSLALIFALHMFRPTPFYVMDEIDAALDYRNVAIIAQYLRQKTENAQFIIISLRNNMFELANRLVGIYKVDGCTKNVSIDPRRVCEMAKAISDNLGQMTCTLPDEVSKRFNETLSRQNKELTAREKQYPNFPSSSEIIKAEKIVSVEGRVRKELNHTDSSSRPQSKATNGTADMPTSSRSESCVNHSATASLPTRSASQTSRTPRKERNTMPDETTSPAKRSNSITQNRTPIKSPLASEKKNNSRENENEEEN